MIIYQLIGIKYQNPQFCFEELKYFSTDQFQKLHIQIYLFQNWNSIKLQPKLLLPNIIFCTFIIRHNFEIKVFLPRQDMKTFLFLKYDDLELIFFFSFRKNNAASDHINISANLITF